MATSVPWQSRTVRDGRFGPLVWANDRGDVHRLRPRRPSVLQAARPTHAGRRRIHSFPFASADSTNIARTICIDGKRHGGHLPRTRRHAQVSRERIEAHQSQVFGCSPLRRFKSCCYKRARFCDSRREPASKANSHELVTRRHGQRAKEPRLANSYIRGCIAITAKCATNTSITASTARIRVRR